MEQKRKPRAKHMIYPLGRLSTKVRSILSLEPPSDANPACISTAMASTTCLSLPTVVSHPSSSSLKTPTTFLHFFLLLTLRPTTTAATAHAATATVTATPSTTLPISPDQSNTFIRRHLPTLLRLLSNTKRRRLNMHAVVGTLYSPPLYNKRKHDFNDTIALRQNSSFSTSPAIEPPFSGEYRRKSVSEREKGSETRTKSQLNNNRRSGYALFWN